MKKKIRRACRGERRESRYFIFSTQKHLKFVTDLGLVDIKDLLKPGISGNVVFELKGCIGI